VGPCRSSEGLRHGAGVPGDIHRFHIGRKRRRTGKKAGPWVWLQVSGGLAIFYESFQLLISRDRKEVGSQDAIVERPIAGLDVEDFIERHQLDERAVVQLRSLPPEELQIIVAGWQGSGEGSVGI